MTPMIDVVFLLVIFFLLSSHLARRETQLELPLPTAATGVIDDPNAMRLTLNVLPDQLLLGSSPIAVEQISGRLKKVANDAGRPVELRIRADQEVEYARIAPALRAAAEAGIWNVNLAVRPSNATTNSGQSLPSAIRGSKQ